MEILDTLSVKVYAEASKLIEKYFYMDAGTAAELLAETLCMHPEKRGIDRRAYLIGDYAVLSTGRLKLRNVETRDDDLTYLDGIIATLKRLHTDGVAVVPILGYCMDENSADGDGFMFQQKAKGREMYDDAIISRFQLWTQNISEPYLSSDLSDEAAMEYLVARTEYLTGIPQAHFDKWISDLLRILREDILVDCNGQSNFFYDERAGFQFIDLDAHNDYRYGLTGMKPDVEEIACITGYTPCHCAQGTRAFAPRALADGALAKLGRGNQIKLREANRAIFDMCQNALLNCGISRKKVAAGLEELEIY